MTVFLKPLIFNLKQHANIELKDQLQRWESTITHPNNLLLTGPTHTFV